MKKVIITGAGGLVGLNLLDSLKDSKYEIIAIDKNGHNLKLAKKINPSIKIVTVDLSKKDARWTRIFQGAFCVIQLQAQISDPSLEPYEKNNIDSVRNVLKACEDYNVKNLVHVSSSVVISVAKDNYSNTKKEGEEIVMNGSVPFTVLRPPLMYGCFDIKHLGFLTKILEKSFIFPVPGDGKYVRQPLYVKDLVNVIINLMNKKPKYEVYNIIGKEKIYFVDMIKTVSKYRKMKRIFLQIPIPLFLLLLRLYGKFIGKKPYEPSQLRALIAGDVFPVSDWEKVFEVKYTPFEDGIKKTVDSEFYEWRDFMIK